jgi:hypothetical protein
MIFKVLRFIQDSLRLIGKHSTVELFCARVIVVSRGLTIFDLISSFH